MFEQFDVLYRGLVIGLMIAAPVGPIGLLCMRRTIQHGTLFGFSTGFGAAFADAFFAAIAAFGIAQITEWIQDYNRIIHLFGGIVLIGVAVHTWFAHPSIEKSPKDPSVGGLLKAAASGLVITLSNPLTFFGTLAVVATFGSLQNKWEALTFVGGVFTGSTAWWLTLSGGIALIRHHFSEKTVLWVNRVTALALFVISLWVIASAFVEKVGHFG